MKTPDMRSVLDHDIKDSTFNKLREIIRARSGISLSKNKQALVKSRLSKRMRILGLGSFEDYLNYVLNDKSGAEMASLLDVISTNVTSFYRESRHFEVMRDVIDEWSGDGVRSLRMWSCACSSGEEPYTMAIETLEALRARATDVKILATDIASSVLRMSLKGEYSEDKMAPVPRHLKSKYFDRRCMNGEYIYSVSQRIREMVLFRQFNLSAFPYPLRGPLDLIFCRNVMIYFDIATRVQLVQEAKRLLRPGGYLFVGHAETLAGISDGFSAVKPSIYMRMQ